MKKKIILITLFLITIGITIILLYDQFRKPKEISCTLTQITDTQEPVITLKGNDTRILTLGNIYEDEGCTAMDDVDGDISNKVIITGKVDTSQVGEYEITYTVSDQSNNTAEIKRKVIVQQGNTRLTSTNTNSKNTKIRGIPVLMYHFFYDNKKGEKGKDNNWMEISAFEEQLKYLSDHEFYFPSWKEIESFIDGKLDLPEKSVVITIDDGDQSFIELAIPIIEKYDVKVTSFLVTSWNADWVVPKYTSNNLEFQSHSHNMHQAGKDGKGVFLSWSKKKVLEDLTNSRALLKEASVFCYPFGQYNEQCKTLLKEANYTLAFTTKNGRVYPGSDKLALPRIRMSKGESISSFKIKVK